MTGARVDHAVVSGTFSLDGETHEVDNNIWVVGDDRECVVIDAPHDVRAILDVVGDRQVRAILLTHAHDDHCRVAPALREAVVAPVMLHPDDRPLWELTHTDHLWDVDLGDGFEIVVGGTTLRAIHTPGHRPEHSAFALIASARSSEPWAVLTGDSLFVGDIASNIAYGRPDATPAQIEEAARRVGALDVVAALPAGFRQPVGERGGGLSAGQRQLVAAASGHHADQPGGHPASPGDRKHQAHPGRGRQHCQSRQGAGAAREPG